MSLDVFKPTKLNRTQYPKCIAKKLYKGERALARYYTANKTTWKTGIITKKFGNLHYIVALEIVLQNVN